MAACNETPACTQSRTFNREEEVDAILLKYRNRVPEQWSDTCPNSRRLHLSGNSGWVQTAPNSGLSHYRLSAEGTADVYSWQDADDGIVDSIPGLKQTVREMQTEPSQEYPKHEELSQNSPKHTELSQQLRHQLKSFTSAEEIVPAESSIFLLAEDVERTRELGEACDKNLNDGAPTDEQTESDVSDACLGYTIKMPLGAPTDGQTDSDERIARQLQSQFDAEARSSTSSSMFQFAGSSENDSTSESTASPQFLFDRYKASPLRLVHRPSAGPNAGTQGQTKPKIQRSIAKGRADKASPGSSPAPRSAKAKGRSSMQVVSGGFKHLGQVLKELTLTGGSQSVSRVAGQSQGTRPKAVRAPFEADIIRGNNRESTRTGEKAGRRSGNVATGSKRQPNRGSGSLNYGQENTRGEGVGPKLQKGSTSGETSGNPKALPRELLVQEISHVQSTCQLDMCHHLIGGEKELPTCIESPSSANGPSGLDVERKHADGVELQHAKGVVLQHANDVELQHADGVELQHSNGVEMQHADAATDTGEEVAGSSGSQFDQQLDKDSSSDSVPSLSHAGEMQVGEMQNGDMQVGEMQFGEKQNGEMQVGAMQVGEKQNGDMQVVAGDPAVGPMPEVDGNLGQVTGSSAEEGSRLGAEVVVVVKVGEEVPCEHDILERNLQLRGLRQIYMDGDGNCQFRAIADQLYRNPKKHASVRRGVAYQLRANKVRYAPYIPGSYREYVDEMSKGGTWGDHVTLQAAADKYRARILLITSSADQCTLEILPAKSKPCLELCLSYYAEKHFNSVRSVRALPRK